MAGLVGFQWQGDIFAGTSLVFEAAGRILKELSDCGIDTYALGGIIQLGTMLPMSQHQERLVAAAMEKRSRTRAGWLARALSLGWGRSDAAYEISRTRGGCAALLMITAFAAGSNALVAAQGIQELMRLQGCEDALLPAVDALRNTIAALTPIMEDSGFSDILNTINVTAIAVLGRLLPGLEFHQEENCLMQDSGTPEEWTDAVYQLCQTADCRQSIYIHTTSRAAWLAAFVVRNLEMDCTVVYQSHVLWSAPGNNGRVTIQIAYNAPERPTDFSRCFTLKPEPQIMEAIPELESTYTLAEALDSEFEKIPNLTWDCRRSIKTTVVDLFTFLATRNCFVTNKDHKESGVSVTGPFQISSDRIESVCRDLGLDMEDLGNTIRHTLTSANRGFLLQPGRDLEFELLPKRDQTELKQICYCNFHEGRGTHYGFPCTLDIVSSIISGFASTALALLPCHLEYNDMRVCARVINGSSHNKNSWRDGCINTLTDDSIRVDLNMLLNHLRRLFHGAEAGQLSKYAVAASGRGVSLAIRALFEDEGFNKWGQYIGVYSGRLDHNGCFRDVVEESSRWVGGGQSHRLVMPSTLAPGIRFLPPNSEFFNPLRVSCQVKTKPAHFEIHCDLVISDDDATRNTLTYHRDPNFNDDSYLRTSGERKILFTLNLLDSVSTLLTAFVGQRCTHPENSALVIPHTSNFDSIETGIFCSNPSDRAGVLVSSYGCLSQQLFSMCSVQGAFCSFQPQAPKVCLVLQGLSCLACAFNRAEQEYQSRVDLYGSAAVICNKTSSNKRVAAHPVVRVKRRKRQSEIIGAMRMDPEQLEAFQRHANATQQG